MKNYLLTNFPRVQKDNKVAVLFSPGYGAGWATWNSDEWKPLLTTHRDIVQCVLDGDNAKAATVAEALIREATGKPDAYVCALGAGDLQIEWIRHSSKFEINEYDGSESIHIIGERDYQEV